MTERFRYVEATDGVDEHIIDYSIEPHFEYYTLKGATDKLNELTCKLKRTERGRTELAEFNVELMEKNKELQQFKKSVFALINEKITFVNECEENHNDIGIPHEYYRGADEILNLLKKELFE